MIYNTQLGTHIEGHIEFEPIKVDTVQRDPDLPSIKIQLRPFEMCLHEGQRFVKNPLAVEFWDFFGPEEEGYGHNAEE